jgi:hypothetical protein
MSMRLLRSLTRRRWAIPAYRIDLDLRLEEVMVDLVFPEVV